LRNETSGILAASAAAAIYGTVPVMARAAYNTGIPAFESVAVRTAVVAVVLCCAAVMAKGRIHFPPAAVPAFIVQTIATGAVSLCYLASVQYIPVGLAVILFFTFPVIIGLVAPLVEHRAPDNLRIIASLVAFAGLALAVDISASTYSHFGLLLAAAAAIGCTIQFFSGRSLAAHMTPAGFGGLVHLTLLPYVVAVSLFAGTGHSKAWELAQAGGNSTGLLACAGVASAYLGGYFLHMTSVRLAKPSTVAPFFNIEPAVSTLLAIALLGERLALQQYAGAALVLVAIIAVSLAGTRKERP
jgi:drug/metabolite transporter (DMT)-like permease